MSDGVSQIRERIHQNYMENVIKVCSEEPIDLANTHLLKVNLSRATLDSVKLFNEYINAELRINSSNYILDLSEVHFMDSTFLGLIVRLLKQIKNAGGNLGIVINYDQINILAPFEQLKKVLSVFTSVEEAINEF